MVVMMMMMMMMRNIINNRLKSSQNQARVKLEQEENI
jgi:hypothetical protein